MLSLEWNQKFVGFCRTSNFISFSYFVEVSWIRFSIILIYRFGFKV